MMIVNRLYWVLLYTNNSYIRHIIGDARFFCHKAIYKVLLEFA